MSLDLYYLPVSGPSRAIQMTAKAVGIKLNLKYLDLMKKEQLKPDFLKINPQHTIPTLVDNGFALWESRAILIYLVEKYGKNDLLYPKDPEKRAIVNQRLFFDLGTFYQSYAKYGYPKSLAPNAPVDPEAFKNFEIAVAYLETFLENSKYVAGDTLTIADISLVVTVSIFEIINYDISKYPNILRWYDLCKRTIPGWDINEAGIIATRQYLETHRQQHRQQQQQQQQQPQ